LKSLAQYTKRTLKNRTLTRLSLFIFATMILLVISGAEFIASAAKITTAPILLTPGNLTAVTSGPQFSWTSVNLAASYRVDIALKSDTRFAAPVISANVKTTYFATVAPLPANSYIWRVRARNADGVGPWSTVFSFDMSGSATTVSSDWAITVYYTAVESYHTASPQAVYGCLTLNCSRGSSYLGTFPSDFVQAVKSEGTGRITSSPNAGMYLNWSINTGYWLDTAPRDDRGYALIPFVSGAADSSVPFDIPFKILDCGVDDTTGSASDIDPSVCNQIKASSWIVRDRFSEGSVGKHVDLYIGEEDQFNFYNKSPKVISTKNATVSMGS
jgi:hypothetical protein